MLKKTLKYFSVILFTALVWLLLSEPGFFILDKTRNIDPGGAGEGVAVYFINLDSSAKRRKDIIPNIKKLGYPYERVTAINGKHLSKEEISQIYDRNFNSKTTNTPLTRGELGIFLSHIKALETFLSSNYKYAIIFEDDITFDPKLLRKLVDNILYQDDRSVDIRYLHRLESHGKAIKITTLKDGYGEFVHFRRFSSSAAYLVNRKAAASIVNYAYPIKLPVDVYLNRAWEFDINEVFIKPAPTLLHDNYMLSDKDKASHVEIDVKTKKKLITKINGFKHRIKTIVARDIYQFVIFFKTRFPSKQ